MVYTGKPSRGCQMCKSRRIKCDEKRPVCGPCTKSNRTCPGYPDEFDLVFRDENKAMERKARKASGSRTGGSQSSPSSSSPSATFDVTAGLSAYFPGEGSGSRTPSDAGQLVQFPAYFTPPDHDLFQAFLWNLQNGVPPTITMLPEVEAVPFFFRNFVSLPQQAEAMRGFLELLVPLYNQARPSSALHLATNAVALAACGNYPGRQDLLREAVTTYGKALKKLNDDLKDPAVSKSDETVLAILLFSLYEVIMTTDNTITAWANHIDGAVALTKMRGTEQFSNQRSHDVFRAVRTMMVRSHDNLMNPNSNVDLTQITSCVQRSKPVEVFPGPYGWKVTEDSGDENAANRLTLICIDLPNLRARATALTNSPYDKKLDSEAHSILSYAQLVDTNLQNWYQTLPSDWQYHTVDMVSEIPEDVATSIHWVGPQHVYEDIHLASIINDYRVCRIFCQSVIMACVNWLGMGSAGKNPRPSAYDSAVFNVQAMVDEISACVPFHMSYEMQTRAKEMGLDKDAAEAFGGYSLVWPLYVAANSETVPQRQRDWLNGRLFVIGSRFGLSGAQVLVLARRHILTCGPMFP